MPVTTVPRHAWHFSALTQYWTKLLRRHNSDHDAAEALLGQIAKRYVTFDRPFPAGRNVVSFDPPLRSDRRRNPPPQLRIKGDDGVPLTAHDFNVTLATAPPAIVIQERGLAPPTTSSRYTTVELRPGDTLDDLFKRLRGKFQGRDVADLLRSLWLTRHFHIEQEMPDCLPWTEEGGELVIRTADGRGKILPSTILCPQAGPAGSRAHAPRCFRRALQGAGEEGDGGRRL